MALYGFLTFTALSCLLAIGYWRRGLYALILMSAIQDPVRKLVPGAPGWLVLCSIAVLLSVIAGMLMDQDGSQSSWRIDLQDRYPRIASRLVFLFVSILIPVSISIAYGPGSWKLTLFGLISYGSILLSAVIGYVFPRNPAEIRRLLAFYCLCSSPMLLGGFIEYFNLAPDLAVVGTSALSTTWIRYHEFEIVQMVAGFYRSPDVMGWHASATTMLALVLAATSRGWGKLGWAGISLSSFLALMLSGRRKMVYMIPIFLLLVMAFYFFSARRKKLFLVVGLLAVPFIFVVVASNWLGSDLVQFTYYTEGALDASSQVERHAFESVIATFRQSGFFGSGLGVAAPGSQYLQVARPRVWQESGPSRLMVELGVPGFIAVLLLLWSALRQACVVGIQQARLGLFDVVYPLGLLSFTLVNLMSLVVSGQILADPFIASFCAITFGLVLSTDRLGCMQLARLQKLDLYSAINAMPPRAEFSKIDGVV
jgi:hypothetical protein